LQHTVIPLQQPSYGLEEREREETNASPFGDFRLLLKGVKVVNHVHLKKKIVMVGP